MDPKPTAPMMMAPGASGASSLRFPGVEEQRWPRIDDHLEEPETSGYEVVRGERILTMGANAEHGDPHCQLDGVLWPHVAPGYVGSTDLQSRFALTSDFASDTCIRKAGVDEKTGRRHLEEIVFEVVNTQHLGGKTGINAKAEDMMSRGVRRVIGLFVKSSEVKEWKNGAWHLLPPHSSISDPCLSRPIPVQALLDAAAADLAVVTAMLTRENLEVRNAAARLLLQQGNPVLLRDAIVDLCEALDIPLTPERQAGLERLDVEGLRALRVHLKSKRAWPV